MKLSFSIFTIHLLQLKTIKICCKYVESGMDESARRASSTPGGGIHLAIEIIGNELRTEHDHKEIWKGGS